MPSTYQFISSTILTTSATTITLSSIPSTFTDLVVKFMVRMDTGGTNDQMRFRFNGVTTSSYAYTHLRGDGSGAISYSPNTTETSAYGTVVNGNTATSNTFSNGELYIPSYNSSTQKPSSIFTSMENNSATSYITVAANLGTATTAISSIGFFSLNGTDFMAGSSFYLYGIKNS
jgi:hypothetical protein